MNYSMIIQYVYIYVYTMYNELIKLISISSSLNIYHFYRFENFGLFFCNYFELLSPIFITMVCCNSRTNPFYLTVFWLSLANLSPCPSPKCP
jgi:hypothetical protein